MYHQKCLKLKTSSGDDYVMKSFLSDALMEIRHRIMLGHGQELLFVFVHRLFVSRSIDRAFFVHLHFSITLAVKVLKRRKPKMGNEQSSSIGPPPGRDSDFPTSGLYGEEDYQDENFPWFHMVTWVGFR